MLPTTYVAQRPGPFAALIQAPDLAGFLLDPLPPRSVRDRYYDTEDGELLRQGLALRVREQGETLHASLRPLRDEPGAALSEAEAALAVPPAGSRFRVPDGPLADALGRVLRPEDTLVAALGLRQYRTPRLAYDGSRLVGLFSFDVVVYELEGAHHVSHELEIERARDGRDTDLLRLDPVLREHSLEPVAFTKYERGLLRVPRSIEKPLLLLPEERATVEALLEDESPMLRRRARVVLLDARGFRTATIAAQTGLSAARVRHWKQLFRERRLGIFADEQAQSPSARPGVPHYRVSELVARARAGEPPARPPEHAEPTAPEPPGDDPGRAPALSPEPPAPRADASGDGLPLAPAVDDATPLPGSSGGGSDTKGVATGSYAIRSLVSPDEHEDPAARELREHEREVVPAPAAAPQGDAPPEQAPVSDRAGDLLKEDLVEDEVSETDAPQDMDALLELFQPGRTDTPLLDEGAARDEDDILAEAPGRAEDAAPGPAEPDATASAASPFGNTDDAAAPDALASGVDAPVAPARVAPTSETAGPEARPGAGPRDEGAPVAETPAPAPASASQTSEAEAIRRPRLRGDEPLPAAADAVLAYQSGQFEQAVARLGALGETGAAPDARRRAAARRLLLAVHRIRLALDVFAPVVPERLSLRARAALRPLAQSLDGALESGATLSVPDRRIVAVRRSLEAVRVFLASGAAQAALQRPADDFVGEAAGRPGPTHLRHVLATALWARYEEIRAFDAPEALAELGNPSDAAYHLVVACAGLHYVLGLAEHASSGPVRAASAALERAEAEAARIDRLARATQRAPDLSAVLGLLLAPNFRALLAGVAASI